MHFAAQGVIAGAYDVVIAAGVESMIAGADGLVVAPRSPTRSGPALVARYPGSCPRASSAELIAEQWGLTREELDAFALESHRRAARAIDEGRFDREVIGVPATEHRRRRC